MTTAGEKRVYVRVERLFVDKYAKHVGLVATGVYLVFSDILDRFMDGERSLGFMKSFPDFFAGALGISPKAALAGLRTLAEFNILACDVDGKATNWRSLPTTMWKKLPKPKKEKSTSEIRAGLEIRQTVKKGTKGKARGGK